MAASAICKAFAEIVESKRIKRGWSKADLAKKMTGGPRGPGGPKPHMSKAMVSLIEKGQCDITLTKLYELAAVLGTKPAKLLPDVSAWSWSDVKVEDVHAESPCETVVHQELTAATD